MSYLARISVIALTIFSSSYECAFAVDQQTNPVDSYAVNLMNSPGSPTNIFGWVRLKNGKADAGYIYLDDEKATPFLGSSRYIVTHMPLDFLPTLLYLLDNSSGIQIRYYDPQATGHPPSAFLETTSKNGSPLSASLTGEAPYQLDAEQTEYVKKLLER